MDNQSADNRPMSEHVIVDGVITTNTVVHLADDDSLPSDGVVTVSLPRWQQQRDELVQRGDCGVRLAGADDVGDAVGDLAHFILVAVEFPAFTDGRGYSHARLLRTRHSYNGELRAVGDVGQDQLFPMQRCGFNAFELKPGLNAERALQGLEGFSLSYQPAADRDLPLFRSVQR